MVDIEHLLEKWLEKQGIDSSKVNEDLFDEVVGRIEDEADEFIIDNFHKLTEDWGFMIITQELSEHPEWKLTKVEGQAPSSQSKQNSEGKK